MVGGVLQASFPNVDFSLCYSGKDDFNAHDEGILQRTDRFLDWAKNREERVIVGKKVLFSQQHEPWLIVAASLDFVLFFNTACLCCFACSVSGHSSWFQIFCEYSLDYNGHLDLLKNGDQRVVGILLLIILL